MQKRTLSLQKNKCTEGDSSEFLPPSPSKYKKREICAYIFFFLLSSTCKDHNVGGTSYMCKTEERETLGKCRKKRRLERVPFFLMAQVHPPATSCIFFNILSLYPLLFVPTTFFLLSPLNITRKTETKSFSHFLSCCAREMKWMGKRKKFFDPYFSPGDYRGGIKKHLVRKGKKPSHPHPFSYRGNQRGSCS